MKIAITGHTAGIGKAFASYLEHRGHEIVGLSKRDGNNIRNIPKIAEKILDCDMFINNAQAGFAQTELFLYVVDAWYQNPEKMIWNISTQMSADYNMPEVSGMATTSLALYRTQKRSLDDATKTVISQGTRCRCITIRPGAVATQPYNVANENSAEVDVWVSTVCDFYIQCRKNKLYPSEINVGFRKQALDI